MEPQAQALGVVHLPMGAGVHPLWRPVGLLEVGVVLHPLGEAGSPRNPLCSGRSPGTAEGEAAPWAVPGAWAHTVRSCSLPGNAVAVAGDSPTQEGEAHTRVGAAGSHPGVGAGIHLLGAAGNHLPRPGDPGRWGARPDGCTAGSLLQVGIRGTRDEGKREKNNGLKFFLWKCVKQQHDT